MSSIQKAGLKRYLLSPMRREVAQEFFSELDSLWEAVVSGRNERDPFWRNVVATRMQDWENSLGYLLMALFSLREVGLKEDLELIVIAETVQEAAVWQKWADRNGWQVLEYGFSFSSLIFQCAEDLARKTLLFQKCLFAKWVAPRGLPEVRPRTILIATLFYNRAIQGDRYEDQFFGSLHEGGKSAGQECLYLGDFLDGVTAEKARRLGQGGFPVFIYSCLSWKDVLSCCVRAFFRRFDFAGATFAGCDLSRILSWYAYRAKYDFNLRAELFFTAVRNFSRRGSFSKLLFAFEGNAYEKAAVQGFREVLDAPVDGYSHAVIFPLNLKLYVPSAELTASPGPDRYLLCGGLSAEAFKAAHQTKASIVPACSLRSIPRVTGGGVKGRYILLGLDGAWSSAGVVDWLVRHEDVLGNYQVVVRPHPNASGKRLKSQLQFSMPKKFRFSESSLKDDLTGAVCVLYRQSSIGIQALMNGIPAVHLPLDVPLDADPIGVSLPGHWTMTTPEALKRVLADLDDLRRGAEIFKEREKFSDIYFAAPSEDGRAPFWDMPKPGI